MKLLLPILVTIAALALGVTLYTNRNTFPNVKTPATPTEQSSEFQAVQAKLILEPQITSVHVGDTVTYVVKVETNNLRVYGVEGYFQYDPHVLSVEKLEPGPFLPKPDVLLEETDPTAQKISYALGVRESSPGSGIAFKFTLKALAQTTGVAVPLRFIQNSSKVALESSDGTRRHTEKETTIVFEEKSITILP